MSTQRRRTTLADVAERSGMSKAAVSMIMNDRPGSRLSADAVERVRAAAAELDYRPNPAAQVLRRGKTRTIGFISDEVTLTRHASGLIGGALEVSKVNDHTMLIAETQGIEGGLARAFETMIDHRVDGILIGLLGARLIDLPSTSTGVPVVVLNGASSSGHANVLPDERAAGYAVAKRLVDAGHRRIGVVGDLPRDVVSDLRQTATVALRFEGIAAAFAEAGIEPARVDIPEWQPEPGYEATVALLDRHPDVTAILAANDGVAFGAYQVLLERGRRIPQDVSVVSFDDEILAGYLRPGLTTARLPYQEIGALGASMLLGRHALGHELVTMPIIERDSLAALPQPLRHQPLRHSTPHHPTPSDPDPAERTAMHTTPTTDVLIAGETLIDIVRRLDRTQAESPGGSPANVGITLGRLGRVPALVTHVGDDERGAAIRSWLDASGVSLVSAPTGRTSTAQATLDADGAATYEFDLSLDLDATDAPDASVVHTGSIATVLEPSASRLRALVESRRDAALITYDPNIRPTLVDDAERVRRTALECIARAHVVKASDEDVAFLHPDLALVDAAKQWVSSGPGLVVVTRGGDGALVVRAGSVFEIATPRVTVADTVGAGDTFMGALIDGLLTAGVSGPGAEERLGAIADDDLRRLLERAARAASVTVSRPGANPPTLAELDA